ncbi:MAG: hypothetical protein QOE53_1495, partial [Pseudonocardiales bacterium]|nr:hypothetical protein [Pseudonocardiales bacterium]
VIRDAHGDPALLALATVDLIFPDLAEDSRETLRFALSVAAVPHWCDSTTLSEVLDGHASSIADDWPRLRALPVVESFLARGADAVNVHEASRLAIRKYLAETEQPMFIDLTALWARVFEKDIRPDSRIEWIYHLLTADPGRGAMELENLSRAWSGNARHQDLAALVAALTELDNAGQLAGPALVRSRLVSAERRADLAGAASVADEAEELFHTAIALNDDRLTADAHALAGDVARARGDLAAADHAFAQALAISERLAALDPTNTGWQRDLARAHNRVGDLAQTRGDLAAADHAYTQDLAISERLAALDPTNTGWQRDLANAHSWVGHLAQTRDDLAAADHAYTQALAILQRLTALDPTNTGWQRNLAAAHSRVGHLAQTRGDLAAADHAYTQALAISDRLAALDPTNTDWQRDLANAHNRIGDLARARGDATT